MFSVPLHSLYVGIFLVLALELCYDAFVRSLFCRTYVRVKRYDRTIALPLILFQKLLLLGFTKLNSQTFLSMNDVHGRVNLQYFYAKIEH